MAGSVSSKSSQQTAQSCTLGGSASGVAACMGPGLPQRFPGLQIFAMVKARSAHGRLSSGAAVDSHAARVDLIFSHSCLIWPNEGAQSSPARMVHTFLALHRDTLHLNF